MKALRIFAAFCLMSALAVQAAEPVMYYTVSAPTRFVGRIAEEDLAAVGLVAAPAKAAASVLDETVYFGVISERDYSQTNPPPEWEHRVVFGRSPGLDAIRIKTGDDSGQSGYKRLIRYVRAANKLMAALPEPDGSDPAYAAAYEEMQRASEGIEVNHAD